ANAQGLQHTGQVGHHTFFAGLFKLRDLAFFIASITVSGHISTVVDRGRSASRTARCELGEPTLSLAPDGSSVRMNRLSIAPGVALLMRMQSSKVGGLYAYPLAAVNRGSALTPGEEAALRLSELRSLPPLLDSRRILRSP